jgi:hypothetical protein
MRVSEGEGSIGPEQWISTQCQPVLVFGHDRILCFSILQQFSSLDDRDIIKEEALYCSGKVPLFYTGIVSMPSRVECQI